MSNTTPTVLDVLRETRRLIAEVGWTQEHYARDAQGQPIDEMDPDATCFCLMGAAYRAGGVDLGDRALDALRPATVSEAGGIVTWNDAPGRTREEVVALLDRVIAEQEGASS